MSLPPDISPLFLSKLTNTAILTAQQVGHFLKNAFYTNTCELSYKEEGRHNLVTQYDIQAEALIISSIKKQFPHHSFLGEEGGEKKGASNDILWIIDPIDGTVNFAHGIPFFSVSIAATFQENVLVGVVYSPITEELFVAEKQQGAYLNGSPLKVSSTSLLVDSLLVTGFPYCVQENPLHCIEHFVSLLRLGIPIRRLGSAALDMAYVAAGRLDGFWEVSLQPWDFAAASLLIEEAGGFVSDYQKKPLSITKSTPIVASNALLHDQILQHLKVS